MLITRSFGTPREPGMRDRCLGILELGSGVRVAVEREQAAGLHRALRQLEVDVLPRRIAVDFHGDTRTRGRTEYLLPVSRDPRPRAVHPASRVSENVHARC